MSLDEPLPGMVGDVRQRAATGRRAAREQETIRWRILLRQGDSEKNLPDVVPKQAEVQAGSLDSAALKVGEKVRSQERGAFAADWELAEHAAVDRDLAVAARG